MPPCAGGIQVPPDGQPILLMADRQVTGGYPILATVITADLPLAAQLAPGDGVAFEVCTRGAALAALRAVGRTMTAFAPRERVPLAGLTTLGVGGPARWFVTATDAADVRASHELVPRSRRAAVGARRRQQRGGGRCRVRRPGAAGRDRAAGVRDAAGDG